MEPLPKPSIDTGMGLERISAILQNVHSNCEIDLFQNLIKSAASIVGSEDLENKSLRVIADHIRSCSFLICDGVMPSMKGADAYYVALFVALSATAINLAQTIFSSISL